MNDLRFSRAIKLVLDVKKPGRMSVACDGTFRYSNKEPRSQAQWEQLLALRRKYVTLELRPMTIDVLLDGRSVGRLVPTSVAERDVPVETLPFYAKEKPRSAREEVVIELAGEVDLPAGRQELMLVPRNVVDGRLDRVRVGVDSGLDGTEAALDRQDVVWGGQYRCLPPEVRTRR